MPAVNFKFGINKLVRLPVIVNIHNTNTYRD